MAPADGEATYRDIFENNPRPMWVCHRESLRFLAVNCAALELYGYQRQEFLELGVPALDPGLGASGVPEGTSLGRHLKKDRSPLELELEARPVQFEGAPATLVLPRPVQEADARIADLTTQLATAQRELETFSYSVSHDLRAPLRHIDGFSRALADDYSSRLDPEAVEYLSRICQAVGKMSQLIDALQQLARVARSELSRQRVNLSVAAQVISLELARTNPDRQVEFAIQEGVSVQSDPSLTRQLLEILMNNAWKFSARVPQSRIEFGSPSEGVYFVRDNGVGFDLAHAEKLFTVFHRLHRADEFEGSGVGLAIAQRIVRRHGGRIWAEATPGEGATFYFTLQGTPS